MEIRIKAEVGVMEQEGMLPAMGFLKDLWGSMSPKDPIKVLLTDSGRPTLRYPSKGQRKNRETLVRTPTRRYPVGSKLKACVRAIKLDPVAAALRGEAWMQDFDEDDINTPAEGAVFLATYMMWNVLRKYGLIDGRKGKAASARYAFANLRLFRSKGA